MCARFARTIKSASLRSALTAGHSLTVGPACSARPAPPFWVTPCGGTPKRGAASLRRAIYVFHTNSQNHGTISHVLSKLCNDFATKVYEHHLKFARALDKCQLSAHGVGGECLWFFIGITSFAPRLLALGIVSWDGTSSGVKIAITKRKGTAMWRGIDGYWEYKVNEYGEVYSVRRNKVIRQAKNTSGYLTVCLQRAGKRKTVCVHRLVAKAFIENPNGYEEVNHKDENKANNSASNLEWCTSPYNISYGTRAKRSAESHRKAVVLVAGDGESHRFESIKSAAAFAGCSTSSIHRMLTKPGKACAGYTAMRG